MKMVRTAIKPASKQCNQDGSLATHAPTSSSTWLVSKTHSWYSGMLTCLRNPFLGLMIFANVFPTPVITAAELSLTHLYRQVGTILVVALVLAWCEFGHLLHILQDLRVPPWRNFHLVLLHLLHLLRGHVTHQEGLLQLLLLGHHDRRHHLLLTGHGLIHLHHFVCNLHLHGHLLLLHANGFGRLEHGLLLESLGAGRTHYNWLSNSKLRIVEPVIFIHHACGRDANFERFI